MKNWFKKCCPWKKEKNDKTCKCTCKNSGGSIYGLGFVGALIYFVPEASGFWPVIVAMLKALVWPAFLVYQAFKFLAV